MTTIRNGALFCTCCGGSYNLNYPTQIENYTAKLKAFDELHKDCPQTWVEPTPEGKTETEKAMWWAANGERGMSSNSMFAVLSGQKPKQVSYPYDPDDFKRCYKLLQAVPEWKSQLFKMRQFSKQWDSLVTNWDKLTEMYEQNEREDWKNYKSVGMYEFMQTLIN